MTAENSLSGSGKARSGAILHVDMDAFFVSVEHIRRPELKGLPVAVGGPGSRGVVASASYEARAYGVHSAMPSRRARQLCPDIVFLPGDHSHYGEVSEQVMAVLRDVTPLVEPLSLDEAFLDVTASRRLFGTGPEIATRIRQRIAEEERLTASVGVASNKYVAKVASDLRKPDALVVVPPGTEREFLAPLSVSRLWGAGPKVQARLAQLGFKKIGDVARNKPDFLEASLGRKLGRRLHELANGLDVRRVDPRPGRKSLGKEVTFPRDVEDRARVERTLLALCEGVARSLRKKGIAGRTVQVKLRWDGFETHTRQRTLARPADMTEAIWPVARELFREADDPRRLVRLIGVSLSGFDHPEAQQLALLGDDPATSAGESRRELAKTMDAVTDRFGRDALKRAALLDSNARGT